MTQPSAQARLTLQDAFERFAGTVMPDDHRVFNNTELKDVRDEALRLERQLAARRSLRNMARLQPFLQGMEHYAKVVEVLCNGTPYLSWVWAPVKLMLMVSVDSLDAFEKLIEAYGRIADNLPRFDRLATALAQDHNFQALLALVYADILEFHRRAYKFVRRKSWAVFFGSMWAGFRSRFKAILEHLAYHSDLVDREAIAVDISEAAARRTRELAQWEKQEREWRGQNVRSVLTWLAFDEVSPEDHLDRLLRDNLPGSCDWFMNHPKIQSWRSDCAANALIWLNGKPGAGKSIISSNLVHQVEASGTEVFFYFCSYLDVPTQTSSRLLCSLAAQIIQKHQDLASYVYDTYVQSHSKPSKKALMALLPELLQAVGSSRIVIDGLDESDTSEQMAILDCILQLLSTRHSSQICKVLIASRDVLAISRKLRGKSKATVIMSLADEANSIDRSIESLIDKKLSDLPEHVDELEPDPTVISQIKHTILEKSNGMFLWVRLVLDSLEMVYSLEDLHDLVVDLPSDLEGLYGRILQRLCNSHNPRSRERVSRILNWICFSQRPLQKIELLNGLAMPPNEMLADKHDVPSTHILDHCKPLIEERPDSSIAFVHFSVREFLLKPNALGIVQQTQAQLDISYACTITLTRSLDLLNAISRPDDNLARVASGLYRLLPYALEHWIEHCLLYAANGGGLQPHQLLSGCLANLCAKHNQILRTSGYSDTDNATLTKPATGYTQDERLKLIVHLPKQHCENGEAAEAFATENDRTLFSKLAFGFEDIVTYLLSQERVPGVADATLDVFKQSYASTAFRCRFPSCANSSVGFASHELRSQHEAGHLRRLYCNDSSCQWAQIGFKNKGSLDAHMRKHHDEKSGQIVPPAIRRIRKPDMGKGPFPLEGPFPLKRPLPLEGLLNPGEGPLRSRDPFKRIRAMLEVKATTNANADARNKKQQASHAPFDTASSLTASAIMNELPPVGLCGVSPQGFPTYGARAKTLTNLALPEKKRKKTNLTTLESTLGMNILMEPIPETVVENDSRPEVEPMYAHDPLPDYVTPPPLRYPPPKNPPSPASNSGSHVLDGENHVFNGTTLDFDPDPYDPNLDADPFGLSASMQFPTKYKTTR